MRQLPYKNLPDKPLTLLGITFNDLLLRTWQSGYILAQWNEVNIINLFKGEDPKQTTNYRRISLISCAFKVLMALMAKWLSTLCKKNGMLLQNVAIKGGPGALTLLRDADAGCLCLACFHLDLDLSLRVAINVWTVSMTHKPYALDPNFDL